MPLLPVVLLLLQAPLPTPIPRDSAEALRRLARRAEREYEYVVRRLAPARMGDPPGGHCDEVVGRFCLRYTSGEPKRIDPEEPGRIVRARRQAIESLRRAFAALPGELTAAGPLVRYLVEDDRAEEALATARTFAWASADSVWGPLVEGYALHALGDFPAAEARFQLGIGRLGAEERRHLERLDVLLSPGERRIYRKLSRRDRERYEDAAWRLADPLYLTPGNETRSEHFARHVWSRLLSQAPVVHGMSSWGDDLEELTIRYGVPTSRERLIGWSLAVPKEGMVEHFDPDQLAFFPDSLRARGIAGAPAPGESWPLENDRARSGYAPASVRKLVALEHQASRFPSGRGVVLRVDGALALDSAARANPRVEAALFVLDTAYQRAGDVRGPVRVVRDTAYASFEFVLPERAAVYSFEMLEEGSRLAARARYSLDSLGFAAGDLALSDPVVSRPFGAAGARLEGREDDRLRPLARLVVAAGDTLGFYAEAHGLRTGPRRTTHYRVELAVQRVESTAALSRALRWLGRTLRITGRDEPPRLAWEDQGEGGEPAVIAVDLPLNGMKAGLYAVVLSVTDLVDTQSRASLRLLLVE